MCMPANEFGDPDSILNELPWNLEICICGQANSKVLHNHSDGKEPFVIFLNSEWEQQNVSHLAADSKKPVTYSSTVLKV